MTKKEKQLRKKKNMKKITTKLKEKSPLKNIETGKLTKNLKEARNAVKKRMFSYIAAGFGLVIGFAWNDAISSLIKQLFPDGASSIFAKFIYAFILTVIIGYTLFYIEKALTDENE